MEMPRLISSLCLSVHSPVRALVSVVFPWSTWPTMPTLTSGCCGTFIRLSVVERGGGCAKGADPRHAVASFPPLRRLGGACPLGPLAGENPLAIAPAGEHQLVAGKADEDAVELVADVLADQ